MQRIREVMTRDVFTLSESSTVGEAAWTLMHRGIGGAPVINDRGQIVGVITKGDLVDAVVCGRNAEADHGLTVHDVMTPAVIAVEEGESLVDAIQLMVGHGVHRIVVLDEGGGAVGILTALDVLRSLVAARTVHEEDRLHETEEQFSAVLAEP